MNGGRLLNGESFLVSIRKTFINWVDGEKK
jgi:hypothetical protein